MALEARFPLPSVCGDGETRTHRSCTSSWTTSRLLSVEYTLPHVEENLEEQREEELERYDEQILAGLVTF